MKYRIWSLLVLAAFAVGEWRGFRFWPTAAHIVAPSTIRSVPLGNRGYYGGGSRSYSGGK
jgi:hypothetical protein